MFHLTTVSPGVFDADDSDMYWNAVAGVLRSLAQDCAVEMLWNGELEGEIKSRLKGLTHRYAGDVRALYARLHDLNRCVSVGAAGAERPGSCEEWLEEALAVAARDGLFAILARDGQLRRSAGALGTGVCVPVEEAHISKYWNSREASRPVARSISEVVPRLATLLKLSKRAWVIDYVLGEKYLPRYIRDGRGAHGCDSFIPGLKACLEAWAQGRQRRVEFVIHTVGPEVCKPTDMAEWVGKWRPELAGALPDDGSRVAIRFWKVEGTGRRGFPRNRCLSTEMGCVQVGKGFDFGRPTRGRQLDILTVLSPRTHRSVEDDVACCGPPVGIALR